MMKYNLGQNEKKNWIVAEGAFDLEHQGKCESIFCVGNGYLGQRAAFEESYVGQTRDMLVNGTFNKFDEEEVTELPNLPDVTNMELFLNGRRFAMNTGTVTGYLRTLDMQTGEVCRVLTWESDAGKRYALRFSRFASMDNEHIIAQKVEVTPLTDDAEVVMISGIDGSVTNAGSQHFHQGRMRLYNNRILQMVSTTTQSKVTCCLHTAHSCTVDGKDIEATPKPKTKRRKFFLCAAMSVPKGKTLVIEKLTAVTTSRDLVYSVMENAAEQAVQDGRKLIENALEAGYDRLFEQSAARWSELWANHDIKIDSDHDFDQLLIRFALYHLNMMVKKDDSRMGIGAKGLTGEGYKGHSFWDTEIFILPYFTLTQPEVAKTLLTYRYHGLYGARLKARENGYEGAMYPWEAAWVEDGEVTPRVGGMNIFTGQCSEILTGLIEQHISSDIAYGVWQYYASTGDQDFMDRYGYEILIDTARFWTSRCEWDAARDAYVITDVIGPDEFKEHVDNNAFTNYMARYTLDLGAYIIGELEKRGDEVYNRLNDQFGLAASRIKMAEISRKLFLPQPNENGIIPQYDGYFQLHYIDLSPYQTFPSIRRIHSDYTKEQLKELQVHKQTDTLMLMLLLGERFSHEVKHNNYFFYEARTVHASSLSRSTHCVLAADLGEDETAYRFFESCGEIDLGPGMSTSDAGVHTASMGGIWQSVVYGFAGVRITNGKLHISPRLPQVWHCLEFRLMWQGQPLHVKIDQVSVHVTNAGVQLITIQLCVREVTLAAGETVFCAFGK